MYRALIPSALLAAGMATPAAAQVTPGGPRIAYVKPVNNGHEIYLVNTDGSGLARVYKGSPKVGIANIDLKPGGNEIAFSENWLIKVQKFYDHGAPNGAATPVTSSCTSFHPDYHPSGDGSFVFITACAGRFSIRQYTPGSGAVSLFDVVSSNWVRWNSAGTHLYYDEELVFNSGVVHLKRRASGEAEAADLGPLSGLNSFDVTHAADQLVYGSPTAPKLFDGTSSNTSQSTAFCRTGDGFHFSPDGARFIYQTPHMAKGDYIMIGSCSSVQPLTVKGTWGKTDWRPDPVAAAP
ncbi:MAG: hypothetical protein ACR2KH_06000 [Sphingomicrobium sp.]